MARCIPARARRLVLTGYQKVDKFVRLRERPNTTVGCTRPLTHTHIHVGEELLGDLFAGGGVGAGVGPGQNGSVTGAESRGRSSALDRSGYLNPKAIREAYV